VAESHFFNYHVKKFYKFFCFVSDQAQFVNRGGGQIESPFVPRGEAQFEADFARQEKEEK